MISIGSHSAFSMEMPNVNSGPISLGEAPKPTASRGV